MTRDQVIKVKALSAQKGYKIVSRNMGKSDYSVDLIHPRFLGGMVKNLVDFGTVHAYLQNQYSITSRPKGNHIND